MSSTTTRSPFAPKAPAPASSLLNWITWALVVIGAINWGLVGLFGIDVIATIFGPAAMLSRIGYIVIGAAGLYFLSVPFQSDGPFPFKGTSRST